jgi:hypothetical protein
MSTIDEIVRQPVTVRSRSRRRLEERLALRLPGLVALLSRAVARLSPRSRLRRGAFRRGARLAFEAVNRGYRVTIPRDAVAGVPPSYAVDVLDNTLSLVATLTTVDGLISRSIGAFAPTPNRSERR